MRPQDLIFDPLTLPISTGQEDYRTAGMETLEAVRLLKKELPECRTILGVSNISFGLSTYSRRVLNSVFLKEAVDRGLDMAIVNYSKIYPLYKIPEKEVDLARKLIFRDTSGGDPLQVYMGYFANLQEDPDAAPEPEAVEALTIEDKLKQLIINGETQCRRRRNQAIAGRPAGDGAADLHPAGVDQHSVARRNEDGRRTIRCPQDAASVGAGFSIGDEIRSGLSGTEDGAASKARERGTIVLATVKGDVHDIGKNLVDIILSNNGYKVVNLGIKQPSDVIIKAAQQHKADAIGLSGLLVKSTLEMKYVIQDLQHLQTRIPSDLRRRGVDSEVCRRRFAQGIQGAGVLRRRCLRWAARDWRSDRGRRGCARGTN